MRSTKLALYRVLDNEQKVYRYPTEETMRTVLFEIAGLLNSRPLSYVSTDPGDYRALTPNDFLNRPPTADTPFGDFKDALPRETYRYVQRTMNTFWDIWKTQYLQSLIPRKKWQRVERNFAVGDIVLLMDKNLPRGQWKVGKIISVYPGEDDLVRVVQVETDDGEYRRAIHTLCLLEPIKQDTDSTADPAMSVSGEHVPANV